jgi:low affinity Fe/Cu permease
MFRSFARRVSLIVGSPASFIGALLVTLFWALSGPHFRYSDTWQLVINTGTTVVTFLIVFLIQHTQNRDTRVVQMKLDELLRAVKPARTSLIQMEELADPELEDLQVELKAIRDKAADKKA